MTKKKYLIALISCIVIIIATFLIINIETQDDETKTMNINLYFFNDNYTSIVAENRNIKYDNERDLPEEVLKELQKGPQDSKNKPILPDGTRLLSVKEKNDNITADFSKEYMSEDASKSFLATYAIVKSLCQITTVHTVLVTVEGEEIVAQDGTVLTAMSDDDIDLVTDTKTQDSKTLTLYFADKETETLVKEERIIKITDTIPVEQYVVNELIKGPQTENAKSIIASDTELISAETTDNTCFVNFKSGFIEKNTGSAKNEELILYSIVDSLCEIPSVKSVQFLVDGKKVENFGSINIAEFFIKNEGIIK